jgi:hypothetical protein
MKHIWVVESSAGRKWNPASAVLFAKKYRATASMRILSDRSPGLKWRVAKYERVK